MCTAEQQLTRCTNSEQESAHLQCCQVYNMTSHQWYTKLNTNLRNLLSCRLALAVCFDLKLFDWKLTQSADNPIMDFPKVTGAYSTGNRQPLFKSWAYIWSTLLSHDSSKTLYLARNLLPEDLGCIMMRGRTQSDMLVYLDALRDISPCKWSGVTHQWTDRSLPS